MQTRINPRLKSMLATQLVEEFISQASPEQVSTLTEAYNLFENAQYVFNQAQADMRKVCRGVITGRVVRTK